ncbi:hypothetical protein B0F90DRAFT_1816499 [Multifurca ochricompacta]|uniref:Uncharacterized protein n=1 Tax=Multifurca ochricompacta TaxID=376703 RepID=A0AAD4M4W5_9AGAM|nr:hypothetical protein B0F90DRAFT_1816499 [Multifurca ochricompacta]
MEQQYIWKSPAFDTSRQPTSVYKAHLLPDPQFLGNFARSAKWCPDGSLALAHCENRNLQYLDIMFPQAAPILDFIWYPRATPRDPSSFCFVASVRESPVRLLDASDGRLRASYKIVDHRERQIAPHSLAFNFPADKLYCGFEDAIEVFDLNRPGEGIRLATTSSKKSKDGLKGIISALAFCPSYDPSYRLYAAGSLTPSSANIALFDEDTGGKPVAWVGDIKASVVQLAFNPVKPHILYASFRRYDEIWSWDLRGNTITPYQTFRRGNISRPETNQKMKFDIDLGGDLMGIGDQASNGNVNLFKLVDDSTQPATELTVEAGAEGTHHSVITPALRFHGHDDAVGSVAFHPLRALLLSVSGSRHFEDINVREGEKKAPLRIRQVWMRRCHEAEATECTCENRTADGNRPSEITHSGYGTLERVRVVKVVQA